MKPEMKLTDKIERVFSSRPMPAQVRLADEVIQLDSDVEEALWFSGRDWHELTWQDWQEHSCAIFFFDPEAFAYYLPSVLLFSAQNPSDSLMAADSLINELDRSPNPEGWTEGLVSRFLELNRAELDVLKEWLPSVRVRYLQRMGNRSIRRWRHFWPGIRHGGSSSERSRAKARRQCLKSRKCGAA
jgi:hypothetical protein